MAMGHRGAPSAGRLRLLLCGDVMTGRGIDQILAHPADPVLYETWAKSALRYVELAEQRNGPIPRRVPPEYIWGDILPVLEDPGVQVRIINLETAVTGHHEPWPGKGIHYRMQPRNIEAITAANVDCSVLANNHVLDWSHPGLIETLETLAGAGLATAGAGADIAGATTPATIETGSGTRVVVLALGAASSGIPLSWGARPDRPGLVVAGSLSSRLVDDVAATVSAVTRPGDVVVASIHWGSNWGYEISSTHRRFAHRLIDDAGVDVVHGHSSHHPLGIDVHHGRLVLYGCGDLINDYEGIGGHEQFHPDLGIAYLTTIDATSGALVELDLRAVRRRRFRLERAPDDEIRWLQAALTRESRPFGVNVVRSDTGLHARW